MTQKTAALIELVSDLLGQPVRDKPRGLYRWACPVCQGGYEDRIYRPLVVADDGRLWCESQFDRSWASASCNFTPTRFARSLNRRQAEGVPA